MRNAFKHWLLFPFLLIWSAWCGLSFSILAVFMFPVLLLVIHFGSPKSIYNLHFLPGKVSKMVLKLWGISITEIGKEKLDPKKQYVFSSNHRSYLDALITGSIIPNYIKFIGKAEILKWPILGYLLKKLYIPVERDNKLGRAWSLEQLYIKAREGASMVILPEGTCNMGPSLLKHFHDGAFRLAIDEKLPMAIMTIIGAGELWPRNQILIRPGKILVYWDYLEITEEFTSIEKLEALKDKVRTIMLTHLIQHYPSGY